MSYGEPCMLFEYRMKYIIGRIFRYRQNDSFLFYNKNFNHTDSVQMHYDWYQKDFVIVKWLHNPECIPYFETKVTLCWYDWNKKDGNKTPAFELHFIQKEKWGTKVKVFVKQLDYSIKLSGKLRKRWTFDIAKEYGYATWVEWKDTDDIKKERREAKKLKKQNDSKSI
ncbi:MAG: hypothetical protein LBV53_02930 [Mycoplasmataceae bacterium]|jgi:hypothetical protein|nr:hypothetical protein [Mycoplasmataceae bacterium]